MITEANPEEEEQKRYLDFATKLFGRGEDSGAKNKILRKNKK